MKTRVIHRRYFDDVKRPDLRALAKCNNINGPLPGAQLTSDETQVTCGRCLRIMGAVRYNSPPFTAADLRLISRKISGPPRGSR